jgi:hypothetical protein
MADRGIRIPELVSARSCNRSVVRALAGITMISGENGVVLLLDASMTVVVTVLNRTAA